MPGNSNKRIKWLLGIILAVGVYAAARAALEEKVYVPLNLHVYPATATPTIVPGIYIITVVFDPPGNPMDEYVEIKNYLGRKEDLSGWTLRDENKNICILSDHFPSKRYTLDEDKTTNVWTKAGVSEVNIGGEDNIYCGFTQPIWNDHGDRAVLKDDAGEIVDDFSYGSVARPGAPSAGDTPVPPTATPGPLSAYP